MRYVIDCSVALKWFVPEPDSPLATRVFDRYRLGEISLIAPEVMMAEFGHGLRSHCLAHRITGDEAQAVLAEIHDASPVLVSTTELASDALRLALAHQASFYDALYVALAIREGVEVLTADERMNTAFGALGCTSLLRGLPL